MNQVDSLRRSTGAARCLDCGKCTTLCPLSFKTRYSARLIAGQNLEEEIRGDGVGIGKCLTCGSCEMRCPEGVRFNEFVRGLRGLIPPEAQPPTPHGGAFQSIARSMSGAGEQNRGLDWLGDGLEVAEQGEVALFVGCLPFFDGYFQQDLGVNTLEIARSAIRILNKAGIAPVLVPQERCCGHDLLWTGDRETFTALAEANAKAFAERGVKRIVTTCAECCSTWRIDYPEAVPAYQPKVEHLSEFVAGRLADGTLRLQGNGEVKLTFQDPCRLARHLGVVDEPRQVLTALPGAKFLEMNRAGRDAVCCGTSGFMHCDAVSRSLQAERLAEASATGAETLVTACPKCLIHFSCAQAEARRNGRDEASIQVKDFTVLAASVLEGNGQTKGEVPAPEGRAKGGTR